MPPPSASVRYCTIPSSYTGTILGSGLISPEHAKCFPKATPSLIRGPLSADFCKMDNQTPCGDPGLLADSIYANDLAKETKWKVGMVPHHLDQVVMTGLASWGDLQGESIQIIDVSHPPRDVVNAISQCACILSSSLHGLIIADSLGIQNQWIAATSPIIGGSFKFEDYYASLDMSGVPHSISSIADIENLAAKADAAPQRKLKKLQANIHDAMEQFSATILGGAVK